MDGERDVRIKPVVGGEFRYKLCLEDCIKDSTDNDVEVIVGEENTLEVVRTLAENPIHIPYFQGFYKYSFESGNADKLKSIVESYVFINPGISKSARSIDLLVRFMFKRYMGGRFLEVMGVEYNAFALTIKSWIAMMDNDLPFNTECTIYSKVFLHSRDSLLGPTEKRNYANQVRVARARGLYADLIHEAAISVVEYMEPLIRVSDKDVHAGVLLFDSKDRSIRTMRNNMHEKTNILLYTANSGRVLRTSEALDKFNQFSTLKASKATMKTILSTLKISKSTYVQFNKLLD